jgi:hypothetical protein
MKEEYEPVQSLEESLKPLLEWLKNDMFHNLTLRIDSNGEWCISNNFNTKYNGKYISELDELIKPKEDDKIEILKRHGFDIKELSDNNKLSNICHAMEEYENSKPY